MHIDLTQTPEWTQVLAGAQFPEFRIQYPSNAPANVWNYKTVLGITAINFGATTPRYGIWVQAAYPNLHLVSYTWIGRVLLDLKVVVLFASPETESNFLLLN